MKTYMHLTWYRAAVRALLLTAISLTCAGSAPAATLTLATTTSTRDTGLLDVLVPQFEQQTGIDVKVVAVGTGQSLELARRGDADVLLVHAPNAEAKFVAEGHGEKRQELMHNDFIIVGPKADPAKVQGSKSAGTVLAKIAVKQSPFISRGDESGTHIKEKALWKQAKVEPAGDWYISAGTGMGEVLRMADQKHAYTLSDRGTYLSQRKKLDLAILFEGDRALFNQYSVIVVSAAKHPKTHLAEARKFAAFMFSPETKKTISAFGVKEYGQPLFFPEK